ncbi:MAG: hypothetical protein A2Y33_13910 [Spirochaetes bacterium GWF1_51_8]|nr:MAG: hypothetical protein A2Y33_13910 [Spirochaetes bacterium GWF1_51_8]
MKKVTVLFLLMISAGMMYPKDMIFGVKGGLDPYTMGNKIGPNDKNYNSEEFLFNDIYAGLFFDALYFRIDIGYNMMMGPMLNVKRTILSGEEAITVPAVHMNAGASTVSVDLLGKLPLYIGLGYLWVGAGVGYRQMLTWDYNGDGVDDLGSFGDMNDFYLLAAAGLDINIFGLIIAPQVSFGYNLTPKPNTVADIAGGINQYWLYEYKYSVGIGLEL